MGGSHAEIPLINAAKAAGYRVATTGNRPADRGHSSADHYVPADFSDPEAILTVAKELGAVAIVSGCNDFAAISTAFAAQQLGLPGHDSYETSLLVHHKDRFRSAMDDIGVNVPRALPVMCLEEALAAGASIGFPVLVKPVDLTGGKGIRKCETSAELTAAYQSAVAISRQQHVLVERFVSGSNHGFTSLVENGKVAFWYADDEQYYVNKYLVSGTTTPSTLRPSSIAQLIESVELIVARLRLVDGLVHVQCIQTPTDVVIIEVCRRCPGDLYPVIVELATGYAYGRAVFNSEAGLAPAGCGTARRRAVARHCIMGDANGVLRSVDIDPAIEARIVDRMVWWSRGDRVDNYLTDKFGILFIEFESVDEMNELAPQLPRLVSVNVE